MVDPKVEGNENRFSRSTSDAAKVTKTFLGIHIFGFLELVPRRDTLASAIIIKLILSFL